jgi:integrase/recombinase XerD
MSKTKAPRITPVFDEKRKRWRLSIPKKYSLSGRRERRFFKTKRQADIEAERLKAMLEEWGAKSRKIDADLATDAQKAHEILLSAGIEDSLSSIANVFVEQARARSASVSFEAAFDAYRQSRQDHRKTYLYSIERVIGKVAQVLGHTNLRDITGERIEKVLEQHFPNPSTFDNALRTLSPLFSMAQKRSPAWIDHNPCKGIEKRSRGRKGPVAILTIEESRQLIAACADLKSDPSLPNSLKVNASDALSAVCIMLFAGVRPAEIKRLTWRNLDLEEGTLFIANTAAKTDRSREIAMPETLIAWLKYAEADKDESMLICPPNWDRKIKAIRHKAGIAKSGKDQLRKSFASYHLQAFGDVNATRSIMGHETDEVLFTNYRNAVRKKDALEFWKIRPSKHD